MTLNHGLQLAYCTNVHPGETWADTLAALEQHTLRVKARVQPQGRFAIGLRLSDLAARELSDRTALLGFQRWLDQHDCYVFTINGFPFGQFHGTRVKADVYRPDWTDPRRLEYTRRLFDLLAELLPPGIEGSVSTSPGSFKDFVTTPEQEAALRANFLRCVDYLATLSERCNRQLHLGVEPEPFGWFENTAETIRFFAQLHDECADAARLTSHLGVNYDACHFAIQYEAPAEAIAALQREGIRLSKIHLSNALRLRATPGSLRELAQFAEDVYLHQVIVRTPTGALMRFRDLPAALAGSGALPPTAEWRVHFHVPLHWQPAGALQSTADHVVGVLQLLGRQPQLCLHLEMETYTWAVLPEAWRSRDVVDQIAGEYDWTLRQLAAGGFAPERTP